ncbi:hypothetical protein C2U71_30330 [Burkholderia ubonensis]|nr:hypothetical protein C2U71_30330 [Burkholderia ubonensis]
MSRFPTIFKFDDGLADLFDSWSVGVVQLIELGQSMFNFSIADGALFSTTEGDRSLQLNLRHRCTVLVVHSRQTMKLLESDNLVCAREIRYSRVKLLAAHARVRRIDLDFLDCRGESLKFGRRTDVSVQLVGGTVERRRSQKDVPFGFRQSRLDGFLGDQAGAHRASHLRPRVGVFTAGLRAVFATVEYRFASFAACACAAEWRVRSCMIS